MPIIPGTINFDFIMSDAASAMTNRRRVVAAQKRVLKNVGQPMLHKFVKENFEAGGRPAFKRNSKATLFVKQILGFGSKPLIASGTLREKGVINPVLRSNENIVWLQLRYPTNNLKASAGLLHDGGEIVVNRGGKSDKQRRFFWWIYYEAKKAGETSIANIFRGAALSTGTTKIKIPARPWTKLTFAQIRQMQTAVRVAFLHELGNIAKGPIGRHPAKVSIF